MNGPTADVPPVWIALLVVSGGALGIVLTLPGAPPPDAARVAETVDAVAAADHEATAAVALDARQVRVDRYGVDLRNGGGQAHGRFVFGPITPVEPDGRLALVLGGTLPREVFETPADFRRALRRARTTEATWRPVRERLRVRRVQYGEVECVLVG